MDASSTRVLLVEDQLSDAILVRRSLRRANGDGERFDVRHANTLAQGLEHLHRDRVDVLLLDLCLPDSEGPSTVTRLRERDGRVPLVVFTGADDPELAALAFEAGADEYLVKDGLQEELLRRTIRHAIERRRAPSRAALRPPRFEEPADLHPRQRAPAAARGERGWLPARAHRRAPRRGAARERSGGAPLERTA